MLPLLRPSPIGILLLLVLSACARQPPPSTTPEDAVALRIVQRAIAAPAAVQLFAVDMEQANVTHFAAGRQPLSVIENRRLSRYVRTAQADGSTLYTYRLQGRFESSAPHLSWMQMRRAGQKEYAHVAFSDGEVSYLFMTHHPDSISRRPVTQEERQAGAPGLSWPSMALEEDSKRANSLHWRGRELIHGVLCDVLDLSVPLHEDAAAGEIRHLSYYVGAADGLIRRSIETRGPPGRRHYSETLYAVDTAFKPNDISYARFEAAVRSLLDGAALPPVIARME